MTLEERVETLEKKLNEIELRHESEDKEKERIIAAISNAAKKGIDDLLLK